MLRIEDFHSAVESGDAQRVAALLYAQPRLALAAGHYGKTGLHLAAEQDDPEIARLLLDAGARLEAETTWRMTPLEWAANLGHREVARVLLEAGAHLHLWAAAGLGLEQAVRGFWDGDRLADSAYKPELRQQADGSWASDPDDHDARRLVSDSFYIACRNGHTEIARFLLDRGADIDVRGFFGGTALHWAAGNGHRTTVELLLDRGARRDLLDERFKATARGWALEFQHRDIAELLAA